VDVSILIISYNTREMTLACIQSVIDQTKQAKYEIIVVDNQSKDGSADAIAKAYPQIKLIVPEQNLGFAGGNNLAATQATGDYLLLLNPDTVILDGAVDKVVDFARKNPKAGAVGGRTYFADMKLNANSCHGIPTPWSLFCMGTGLSSAFRRSSVFDPESLGKWERDTVREVPAITGCFLLIDRALWNKLGGFDLDFFMYSEDTDLSARVWKEGRSCLVCPDARLIHYGGQADKIRPDKMVRLFRAKGQFFYKHWPKLFKNYGVQMLAMWAGTRTMALWVLQWVKPAKRESFKSWQEIWRRRREFHPLNPSGAVSSTPKGRGGSNGPAGPGSDIKVSTSQ
jgi:N-acetylglucosaminyl-diphospho-decaprenol L-rhamnosyltransferase